MSRLLGLIFGFIKVLEIADQYLIARFAAIWSLAQVTLAHL